MNEYELTEGVISMRNRTVRLDREGDYWTDEEKEQLVRLFRVGEGITAIAIWLQRTEPAIMQQIEKMDLYRRKESPVRRKMRPSPLLAYATTVRLILHAVPAVELACNRWRENNV